MLYPEVLLSIQSVPCGSNGDSQNGPMKWLPMFYTVTVAVAQLTHNQQLFLIVTMLVELLCLSE